MNDRHGPNRGAPVRSIYGDLPCTVCMEELHRFVEGEADPALARAITGHLRRCAACAERRRGLEEERIEFMEAAIRSPALSPRFGARIIEEIERRGREKSVIGRLGRWRFLGIASAAAAALTAVLFFVSSREAQAPSPFVLGPVEAPAAGADSTLAREGSTVKEDTGVDAERKISIAHVAPRAGAPAPAPSAPFPPAPAQRPACVIALTDSIEVLSSVLRVDARLPCSDDVNRDGESDLSDAAHFFMLAVASTPAGIGGLSPVADMDLDCVMACVMQARL